jgi:SAM-dependent methyltransferase
MGIDIETARFLLARRRDKVAFERCATLGRQHYFVSNTETRSLLRESGLSPEAFPALFPANYPGYSEPFWEMLGVKSLATVDASKFEGATHVHDMNQPIPPEWREAFDVVCDVGTLEHVFNFPVAIRNCMEMVKRGGCFFAQTPANNYFGHGFYQFSPELFFRVLSPQNGFQVEHCVAVEQGPRRRWFSVTDPEAARARVTLINTNPVVLFVWAKRIEVKPLFAITPQQSDYAVAWAGSTTTNPQNQSGSQTLERIKKGILNTAPRLARALDTLRFSRFSRGFSFRNKRSFTRISKLG